MSASATNAPAKPTLAMLVAISALQPIALNLLAPSTPALARHFATNYATIQFTLTLFLTAVAVMQLVIGPLSDRFGRRPCVQLGVGLFVLGSLVGAFAPSPGLLMIARMLEGAGSGIAFALSRAIIRDTSGRDEAASRIASVTMVMVVAPMLSPFLGGHIESWAGWRAIFWFMTAAGVLVLAATIVALPETAPRSGRQSSLLEVFGAVPVLIRDRVFLVGAMASGMTSAAFFGFVAAAPHVVVETMGRQPADYGAWFILTASGYMIGNFAMSRLARRIGSRRMIGIGLAISCAALTVAFVLSFNDAWSPAMLFVPLAVNAIGNGLTIPGATAEALSARPELAGSAAGLTGAFQLGSGALASVLLSWVVTIWPQALPAAMWLMTLAALAVTHAIGLSHND